MRAAVVIEGIETHTRTGFVRSTRIIARDPGERTRAAAEPVVRVPVTHAKVSAGTTTSTAAIPTCCRFTVHVAESFAVTA